MPRIPVYQTSNAPGGTLQPGRMESGVPSLAGLARGAQQYAAGVEHQRAEEDRLLRDVAVERQHEEAQRQAAEKAQAQERFLEMKDLLADSYEEHAAGIVDGTRDKTSAQTQWSERSKVLIDMAAEKIPPSQRQRMQALMSADAGRYERLISRVVRKRDQADTSAAIDKTLEFAARQSETDYEGARIMAMQTLDQLGPFAGMDAATIQKKANAWREEAAYTRGLGALSRAKKNNAALTKVEGAIQQMGDLDPRRKVELLDRAAGYRASNDHAALVAAQKAEIATQRHERQAAQAWGALSDIMLAGKMPDEATLEAYSKKLRGTAYEKALPTLIQQVKERSAPAMLPVSQQQAQLDQLRARAAQGTNPALEAEIKRRENVLSAARTDYKSDPIGAYIERGLGTPTAIDFNQPETLKARAAQAEEAAIQAGRPVGALRPHEASAMAELMGKMSAKDKESFVATVYQSMGPRVAQATFAQLSKDAPFLAVAAGLAGHKTTNSRNVSQLMFQGEELLKTKSVRMPGGDSPEKSVALNVEFQKIAGNAIPNPQARQMATDAAAAVYAKLMHEAGRVDEKTLNASTWKQAVRLVTGGVIEHNGQKILPPAWGLDEDKSRDLLKSVTPAQVKAWGGVAGMTDDQAAEYIRSAPLESQTIGKYRVLAGAGILQRPDGSPFEMVFR